MNKILITRREGKILTAFWDGKKVLEFRAEDEESEVAVGDIRIGKVKNIVKNIHAAFVEVSPGMLCFMQLPDERKINEGMELPVQVIREAVSTKAPVVSDRLSLAGRYLVQISDRRQIAVSSKIRNSVRREELKSLLASVPEEKDIGFIVRTNAEMASDQEILDEAYRLADAYAKLHELAAHRTAFSLMRAGKPAWLTAIRDARAGSIDQVITDQKDLYDQILESDIPGLTGSHICFYDDPALSMNSLYRLEHFLEMATCRKVWLKSGGYLVIDRTEAMTVIDVNSGKFDGKKKKEAAFLKINEEAAREIAFQARLRNISGIILVDFIDLEEESSKTQLAQTFADALSKDPIKTSLVDFTALGLAEVTRKKTRRPLIEQLRAAK